MMLMKNFYRNKLVGAFVVGAGAIIFLIANKLFGAKGVEAVSLGLLVLVALILLYGLIKIIIAVINAFKGG